MESIQPNTLLGQTMNHLKQSPEQMVFSTTMSAKARIGFGIAALFPLLAPYNLLIRHSWSGTPTLAFLIAAVVSIGAIIVSVLLLLVAIFGINRRVEFDTTAKTIHVAESHLLQSRRDVYFPFYDIVQLELVCHDWSDGPSTYDLRLISQNGKSFAFGDFSSRVEAETTASTLRAIMRSPS